MNRGAWKSEVLAIVGRPGDTTLDTRLNTYADIMSQQIARAYWWPELFETDTTTMDTVANVPTVALPTRTRSILSLRLIDGSTSWKLIRRQPRRTDRIHPAPSSEGTSRPTRYIQYDENVELIPVPDDAYDLTIRRAFWPALMADDAADFIWSGKDDLIIQLGVAWCYAILQEEQEAAFWMKLAQGSVGDAVKFCREELDWEESAHGFSAGAMNRPRGNYWLRWD